MAMLWATVSLAETVKVAASTIWVTEEMSAFIMAMRPKLPLAFFSASEVLQSCAVSAWLPLRTNAESVSARVAA